jgi:hypothetical protein
MDVFEEVSQDIKQAAREDKSVPAFQKAASGCSPMASSRQIIHRSRDYLPICRRCSRGGDLLFLKGIFCQDINAASGLSDLIKVAVLPVVTLVIGYYFGSKSE